MISASPNLSAWWINSYLKRSFIVFALNSKSGLYPSGTPVRVQLLGQHPNCLAENAHRAIELGSHGIDLNCGCPSKTVNGSNGGAALLKQPELIYQATLALRKTVP